MSEPETLRLIAYAHETSDKLELPIVPASLRRDWMNFHDDKPYRCLPLDMANQLGWFLLNPAGFAAEWAGESADSPIRIEFDEELTATQKTFLMAYFGNGVLTWHIPYLFRTSPGYNLLARGPANAPKDGIQALEGLVESDWIDATFTMNWKFTRAHHPIRFEKGEPFCMITPMRRGEIERFEPSVEPVENNPSLDADYAIWREKRNRSQFEDAFRQSRAKGLNQPYTRKYNLSYMRGLTASGQSKITDHQTKLTLKPFLLSWQEGFSKDADRAAKADDDSSAPGDD